MTLKHSPDSLKNLVITSLEDLKALDITLLPVSKLTTIADYMIICSGTSSRHTQSLARNVMEDAKTAGYAVSIEGEQDGEWVLLDIGDVIVHMMLPTTRAFYNLEGLWQEDAA